MGSVFLFRQERRFHQLEPVGQLGQHDADVTLAERIGGHEGRFLDEAFVHLDQLAPNVASDRMALAISVHQPAL